LVRPMYALEQELNAFIKEKREMQQSELTIHQYEWSLHRLFQALHDFKKPTNPRKIRREDLEWLRDEFITGTNRYKENELGRMMIFLRWAGHADVHRWRIPCGDTSPTRVRWLSDQDAARIRHEARGTERFIVHFELDLGMRRVEVLRLTTASFQSGNNQARKVLLHGKGRNGGKYRQISWHPDTAAVLDDLRAWRAGEIAKAIANNPKVKVPDNLLIYERGGKLQTYSKSGVDKMLYHLGERVGVYFTNHDLRRTCGRMMYRSGVRLEKIAKIFGHADTRTTIRYLGLDFEDMDEAMAQYSQYQNSLIVPKMVQYSESQIKSGQGGI
jgi:integrase